MLRSSQQRSLLFAGCRMKLLLFIFVLVLPALCAQDTLTKSDKAWWGVSLGAHAAGSAADGWTSYQAIDVTKVACEGNPIINAVNGQPGFCGSQFGERGWGVKAAVWTIPAAVQAYTLKKYPSHRTALIFSIANFVAGGIYAGIAIHNASLYHPVRVH